MSVADDREFSFRDADFRYIAQVVRTRTGIVLNERKRELVYGRLARRLRALKLASFAGYCDLLEGPQGGDELGAMINAITTNLTGFFREPHHFDHLAQEALARRVAAGAKRLRLWSAGCSSGEEPYSIAMVLREALPAINSFDARILATDIDTDMIARGIAGRYPTASAKPIPPRFRGRWIERAEDSMTMAPPLRQLITFKPLNLLEAWPMRGTFDAIFCRNVVIYFDKDQQRVLFNRFAELLSDDGWLYIGHSESLIGVSERFELVGRTIYRKVA